MKARRALKHGSLFCGLGGFDLGLHWAGFETVWQVEIDRFCRKVLGRHFPNATRFKDITKCNSTNLAAVDIITGGFPCTDISDAGKRAGFDGERSKLFWEMHRIVCELRPSWCVIENVPALRDRGADEVIGSMEKAGYAVWPLVVGAGILGAPHRRNRAWIVCHLDEGDGPGARSIGSLSLGEERELFKAHQKWFRVRRELGGRAGHDGRPTYQEIRRTFYGVPHRLDRLALAALGNAAVPQIPMLIGSFIRQYEEAS